LLRAEGHAVRVALALDRRRLPVPPQPAERVAGRDELVVVELRPAEPRPPLRSRLALLVLHEVAEKPPRVACLRACEQPVAERGALGVARDCLLARRTLVGREAPGTIGRPDREQPPVQLERRPAVLLVVALDVPQERLVARLEPRLEGDDGVVAALDARRALEPVERLDRLDRVARRGDAERLAHDPVEVDEHLLAQEVVDLALARPVLAHEPRESRALVGGVVVDVKPRVTEAPLDDPVDEPLEHSALAFAVAGPERLVAHLARLVAVAVAEQELEPARGLVERMPLEVEPDVAGVRLGQEAKATLLLVVQELVQVLPRRATAELELGLVTHPLEALGPQAVWGAVARHGERAQPGERLDAVRDELLRPAAAHPGHEQEMGVGLELRAADVPEGTDSAVPARPRVRLVVALERREEPLAHAPVVRVELGDPEALPLAAAVLDVHTLDGRFLQPLDDLGVEQELEDVRGLRRPRKLRVDRLVCPLRRLLEEVREPVPAPIAAGEVRLVHDVSGSGTHRVLGESPRDVGVEALVVVGRDSDDRAALPLEPLEVRRLVLPALAEDQVDVRVVDVRSFARPVDDLEREGRQMRAGEVRREVGRREPQSAVGAEAHTTSIGARPAASYVSGCTESAPT